MEVRDWRRCSQENQASLFVTANRAGHPQTSPTAFSPRGTPSMRRMILWTPGREVLMTVPPVLLTYSIPGVPEGLVLRTIHTQVYDSMIPSWVSIFPLPCLCDGRHQPDLRRHCYGGCRLRLLPSISFVVYYSTTRTAATGSQTTSSTRERLRSSPVAAMEDLLQMGRHVRYVVSDMTLYACSVHEANRLYFL